MLSGGGDIVLVIKYFPDIKILSWHLLMEKVDIHY